jgi:predicted nucleic acid-binding protein
MKSLLIPFINSQVLAEVANVCRRKFKYDKKNITNLWADLLSDCRFIEITTNTVNNAVGLVTSFDLQIFDSLIVASSLEAGCHTLYSEDMHHSMVVDNKLTIINPFRLSEPNLADIRPGYHHLNYSCTFAAWQKNLPYRVAPVTFRPPKW